MGNGNNEPASAFLQTATGGVIDILHPTPGQISIEDIAIGLSNVARYAGQTQGFYSVAMHSAHMAEEMLNRPWPDSACNRTLARQALLHDAAEAYIGDLASPVKALLPGYKEVEARIMAAVWERFNLPHTPPTLILAADLRMRATEVRDLFVLRTAEARQLWADLPEPYAVRVRCHTPTAAYAAFVTGARDLGLWPENDKAA